MPSVKEEIEVFSNNVINSIVNGDQSALEVDYLLKTMEMTIDKIRKHNDVKNALFKEIDKLGSNSYFGAKKISIQSRSTYDFSNCPAWVDLDTKKKELEKLMKVIDKPMADTETGEEIQPATKKESSSFVKYEF
jgi:hypothetical protein